LPLSGRTVSGLALVAVAGTLLTLPAVGLADNPDELRARNAELQRAEDEARLELFALQSRLAEARSALAGVESRVARVDHERSVSRKRLAVARKALAAAERHLGEQVRVLYIHEEPDTLAIFLGAASLEDAIDSVDAVERTAEATSRIVDQTRAARAQVTRLLRRLTKRRDELRDLRTAAVARTSELQQAETARLGYISRLRSERVLNEQEIAQAIAAAEAAQAAAALQTATATTAPSISSVGTQIVAGAPPPPAPPPPQPSPQAPVPTSGKQLTVVATAYTLRGTTATGIPTGPGVVAVDPAIIPLGTRMTIPGYGEGVAADTGLAIKGNRIDVWVATEAEAAQWQWKTVTITLH